MTEGRKALHAYVSTGAHEQWHSAAQTWGVSVSALLEALAPDLPDVDIVIGDRGDAIVTTSRQIDAQRRRRRRT